MPQKLQAKSVLAKYLGGRLGPIAGDHRSLALRTVVLALAIRKLKEVSLRHTRSGLVVLAVRHARKRSRLDHARLGSRCRHVAAVDDVANHDLDVALAVRPSVRCRRFAPAAIQQDACGRHARTLALAVLRDASKHLDA